MHKHSCVSVGNTMQRGIFYDYDKELLRKRNSESRPEKDPNEWTRIQRNQWKFPQERVRCSNLMYNWDGVQCKQTFLVLNPLLRWIHLPALINLNLLVYQQLAWVLFKIFVVRFIWFLNIIILNQWSKWSPKIPPQKFRFIPFEMQQKLTRWKPPNMHCLVCSIQIVLVESPYFEPYYFQASSKFVLLSKRRPNHKMDQKGKTRWNWPFFIMNRIMNIFLI